MTEDTNTTYETVLGGILARYREAGAKTEKGTERDGAFSYHAETHAAGLGVGLGVIIGSGVAPDGAGKTILGTFLSAILAANRGEKVSSGKIVQDVAQEPHYFIGGFAFGFLIGGGISAFIGVAGGQ